MRHSPCRALEGESRVSAEPELDRCTLSAEVRAGCAVSMEEVDVYTRALAKHVFDCNWVWWPGAGYGAQLVEPVVQ